MPPIIFLKDQFGSSLSVEDQQAGRQCVRSVSGLIQSGRARVRAC